MRPSFVRRFVIPIVVGVVGGVVILAAISIVAFVLWTVFVGWGLAGA